MNHISSSPCLKKCFLLLFLTTACILQPIMASADLPHSLSQSDIVPYRRMESVPIPRFPQQHPPEINGATGQTQEHFPANIRICNTALIQPAQKQGAPFFDAAEESMLEAPLQIDADIAFKSRQAERLLQNQGNKDASLRALVVLQQPEDFHKAAKWTNTEDCLHMQRQIHHVQEALLTRLGKSEVEVLRFYDNLPCLFLSFSEGVLSSLVFDGEVLSIEPAQERERFTRQGMEMIHALPYRDLYTGQGVSIAVIDSAFDYTHPALGGGGFPNTKIIGGYDFADNDADPFPDGDIKNDAHGTCVAGIAAGARIAAGDYDGGIAHNARIYALKVADSKSGSIKDDTLIAAMDWCASHQYDAPSAPLLVINLSLGGGRYASECDDDSLTYSLMTRVLEMRGITVVAAAGNNGFCDALSLPACLSRVISTGAVYDNNLGDVAACMTPADTCLSLINADGCPQGKAYQENAYKGRVTFYSNSAASLNVFAPSDKCYTPDITGASGYSDGNYYDAFGGTSAASPYIAGVVACMQEAVKTNYGIWLAPRLVRKFLSYSATPVTDPKAVPRVTKPLVDMESIITALGTAECSASLLSPAANAVVAFPVSFSWSLTSACTESLYLVFSPDEAGTIFATLPVSGTAHSLMQTAWEAVAASLGAKYACYWTLGMLEENNAVRAIAALQRFQWETPVEGEIEGEQECAATLLTPAMYQEIRFPALFTWQLLGPCGETVLLFSSDTAGPVSVPVSGSSALIDQSAWDALQKQLGDHDLYYWSIGTVTAQGTTTALCSARAFTLRVEESIPECAASLTSPTSGEEIFLPFEFTWELFGNCTQMVLLFAASPENSSLFGKPASGKSATLDETTWEQLRAALGEQEKYYWTLGAALANSQVSALAPFQEFSVTEMDTGCCRRGCSNGCNKMTFTHAKRFLADWFLLGLAALGLYVYRKPN